MKVNVVSYLIFTLIFTITGTVVKDYVHAQYQMQKEKTWEAKTFQSTGQK